MKFKILLFIVASVFCIAFASADLIVSYPQNISVQMGIQSNFSMSFQNTYNFSIFNLSFTNLTGFSFPSVNLAPNTSQSISFSVLRTDAGQQSINSVLSFQYLTSIPQGIKTFQVNITQNSGFNPSSLQIRRGDTVQWNNQDQISRSVTSAIFDQSIQSNQSFSYTFNQLGDYPYQDLVLFFGGDINVINETEFSTVNNPNYNQVIPINLKVNTNPTILNISNSQLVFTINATNSQDGLLTIQNTGNDIAHSITLSSNIGWIGFDSNNFDLAQNQLKYVVYHIRPAIFQASDSNKTYNLTLKVTGLNFPEIDQSLSVFIPFDGDLSNINTQEGIFAFFTRYCSDPSHANFLLCNNTVQSSGNQTIVVTDQNVTINISASQILAMARSLGTVKDTISRQGNSLNDVNAKLDSLKEIINLTNSSYQKQIDNESSADNQAATIWIILIIVVPFGTIFFVISKAKLYNSKKNLYDGGMNVR